MNTRTTVIVLLIAIALGAYLVIFELGEEPAPRREEPGFGPTVTGEPVFDEGGIDTAAVTTITLTDSDGDDVVLRKADGEWYQVEPVRFKVNNWSISDIPSDVAGLKYTKRIEPSPELTLERMGLDPARLVLTLEGEGVSRTIRLGRAAAVGRAYAQIDDASTVYVVNEDLHEALVGKTPSEWRRRSLEDVPLGRTEAVRIEREGKPTVELIKRDGKWALAAPVTGRADREAVEKIIQAINNASIDEFIEDEPESLASYGLAEPGTTVTVEIAAAQSAEDVGGEERDEPGAYVLKIGSPRGLEGESFAAMVGQTPVVFSLTRSTVEKFDVATDDLRDPNLTPVARADVRGITVERPNNPPIQVVKEEGRWTFGEPAPEFEVDRDAADALLTALVETTAEDFIADAEIAEPLATVKMAVLGAPEAEVLRVGEHPDDAQKLIVVRGAEATGCVVTREDLRRLFDDVLAYRDKLVADLDEDDLVRVRIERTGEFPLRIEVAREKAGDEEPGGWAFAGYESSTLRQLIGKLTPLRADDWLAEPPASEAAETKTVITIAVAAGATRTLTAYPDAGWGEMSGVDRPFRISDSLANLLAAEYRDRTVLDLNLDDMASVKRGDVTVSRDEEGNYTLEGDGELDETAAGGLFDTLAGLRAEHYLPEDAVRGEGDVRIVVTTREEASHSLAISASKDKGVIVRVDDDSPALIAKQDAEKLTAKLVK